MPFALVVGHRAARSDGFDRGRHGSTPTSGGVFRAGSVVLDRDAEVFERLVAGALDHDAGGGELLQVLDDRGSEPFAGGGDRDSRRVWAVISADRAVAAED